VFSVELRVGESVAPSHNQQLFPMRQSLSTHVLPNSMISASTHAAQSAANCGDRCPTDRRTARQASQLDRERRPRGWWSSSVGDVLENEKRHGPRLHSSRYIRLLALSLSNEQHWCTSTKWLQKQTHLLRQQQSTSVPYHSPRCQHPIACAASSANSEDPTRGSSKWSQQRERTSLAHSLAPTLAPYESPRT
jgi:hypothetical protein